MLYIKKNKKNLQYITFCNFVKVFYVYFSKKMRFPGVSLMVITYILSSFFYLKVAVFLGQKGQNGHGMFF